MDGWMDVYVYTLEGTLVMYMMYVTYRHDTCTKVIELCTFLVECRIL